MRTAIFFILLFASIVAAAQRKDKKLHRKIEEVIQGFNGNIGVYIKDLKTNKTVAINADTSFPTASMVKVPILIGVMDKDNKGE